MLALEGIAFLLCAVSPATVNPGSLLAPEQQKREQALVDAQDGFRCFERGSARGVCFAGLLLAAVAGAHDSRVTPRRASCTESMSAEHNEGALNSFIEWHARVAADWFEEGGGAPLPRGEGCCAEPPTTSPPSPVGGTSQRGQEEGTASEPGPCKGTPKGD